MDLLAWTFALTLAMLCVTCSVATFDIVVVWFGVWIPLRRSVAPEDRPYLWRGVASYAKASREEAEDLRRLKDANAG